MENLFKGYEPPPVGEIIPSDYVARIRNFENHLNLIRDFIAKKLLESGVFERLVSGENILSIRQEVEEIGELGFISSDGAAQQIAFAMMAGFQRVASEEEGIDPKKIVSVNLFISKNTPDQAEFTLLVVNEDKK